MAAEFLERHPPFGFEPDIDYGEIFFYVHHLAGDNRPFLKGLVGEELFEKGGEFFAGWVEFAGLRIGH